MTSVNTFLTSLWPPAPVLLNTTQRWFCLVIITARKDDCMGCALLAKDSQLLLQTHLRSLQVHVWISKYIIYSISAACYLMSPWRSLECRGVSRIFLTRGPKNNNMKKSIFNQMKIQMQEIVTNFRVYWGNYYHSCKSYMSRIQKSKSLYHMCDYWIIIFA